MSDSFVRRRCFPAACIIIIGGMIRRRPPLPPNFSSCRRCPPWPPPLCYDQLKHAAAMPGVGFVTAFFTAMVSIKALLYYVSRFSFIPFAVYRIILGAVLLAFVA